jgi:hypothetical protein
MPTRDLSNQPMQYSLLVGPEVSTGSEEWKHECEVAFLASKPLSERNEIFDAPGWGMKSKRGEAAVARLRAEVDRYAALKAGSAAGHG